MAGAWSSDDSSLPSDPCGPLRQWLQQSLLVSKHRVTSRHMIALKIHYITIMLDVVHNIIIITIIITLNIHLLDHMRCM